MSSKQTQSGRAPRPQSRSQSRARPAEVDESSSSDPRPQSDTRVAVISQLPPDEALVDSSIKPSAPSESTVEGTPPHLESVASNSDDILSTPRLSSSFSKPTKPSSEPFTVSPQ